MTRVLLVDAELYAWRAATAACSSEAAVRRFDGAIETLKRRLMAETVVMALSDAENWRRALLPSYKSGRRRRRRPALLAPLLEHVQTRYDARKAPSLEADDVLGLLATGAQVGDALPRDATPIVVSADKDLRSVPGLLCADQGGKPGIARVSRAEADRAHLGQTLAGDAVDGYRGCPGVGAKTAAAFLSHPYLATRRGAKLARRPTDDVWAGVVSLFEKAGLDEAAALVQARVARILRAGEYDAEAGEPRLWRPAQLGL